MKKRRLIYLGLTIIVTLCSNFAFAQSIFDYNGITYKVLKDADEASTIGTVAVTAKSDGFYEGTITIPNAVKQSDDEFADAYKVVAIDDVAFKGNPTLTKVVLPITIESIGNSAFAECVQLTEVVIPQGNLTQIGERAFASSGLKAIKLPEGITELRSNTFNECRMLEQVVLPESLLKIDEAAFMFCQSLKTVELPQNLREIGTATFCYCGLTSISLPNRITVINVAAFAGCFDLEEVHLSEYTTTIKGSAFQLCNLKTINKPQTLKDIEDGAFESPYLPEWCYPAGSNIEFLKSDGYIKIFEEQIRDMKKTMWK